MSRRLAVDAVGTAEPALYCTRAFTSLLLMEFSFGVSAIDSLIFCEALLAEWEVLRLAIGRSWVRIPVEQCISTLKTLTQSHLLH